MKKKEFLEVLTRNRVNAKIKDIKNPKYAEGSFPCVIATPLNAYFGAFSNGIWYRSGVGYDDKGKQIITSHRIGGVKWFYKLD